MDVMNKEATIKQQISKWRQEQQPLRKTSLLYSWLRLAVILLAIFLAIYADQSKKSYGYGLAGICILFFLVLIYQHNKIKTSLRQNNALIQVGEHLQARMDGSWRKEASNSICDKEDTLAYDLDLLGPQSLYDYVSICATPFGKQHLLAWLCGEEDGLSQVKRRQGAVKELLKKETFLFHQESRSFLFQEDAMKIKEENLQFLIHYGQTTKATFPKWLVLLSMILSIGCIASLGLGFFNILPYGYGAVLMLVNLIISMLLIGITGPSLAFTKNLARILKDYHAMFATIDQEHFDDPYLQELQTTMLQAKQGLQKLNQVMDVITLRHNIISYLILASICQIDVWCVALLEHWRKRYGTNMEVWLSSVGELEALISLSTLGQIKETICFPDLLDQEEPRMELVDGKHPLLQENQAVANTIAMEAGSMIITGSNMSGKTTFLRTIGISMMLARAGTCVNAKQMSCVLMDVHSSMRVKDDVTEGISTFYAELLRIRHMMDAANHRHPMLVLIDEIFKGTNSADRILCAKTAITKLHQPWIITMVSTHDFELCALDKDPQVQATNYHFSEYYEQDEIKFDYTLKKGRCTSTNAKELMRLAGIIERKEDLHEY